MSQVVRRAAAILRALEEHPQGRSVGEIAKSVDLPRSTVHRVLKSLEHEHLVASASEGGGFRLGAALMRLASSANSWLTETIHRHLADLSRGVEETVDLALLSGSQVHFIDQVAAPNRLQAVSQPGLAFPAYCTANGKALLAELDDEVVLGVVGDSLAPVTRNTITDPAVLLEELAHVRANRVAFDREEHHLGISAVGTALDNPYGLAVALSVPVPTARFVEREDRIVEMLLAGRDHIEAHLNQQ